MLKKDSIQPLYRQLMDEIISEIQHGLYHYGDKIPTEAELSKTYNVSRITVRRTIEELCSQGYLSKRQGKGTFVERFELFEKFQHNINAGFADSCEKNHCKAVVQVLSHSIQKMHSKDVYAKYFQTDEEIPVLCIETLLSANDIPLKLEYLVFPSDQYLAYEIKEWFTLSDLKEIEDKYMDSVTSSPENRTISVANATQDQADKLRIPIGEPLLVMDTHVNNENGQPVFISKSYLAINRCSLNV